MVLTLSPPIESGSVCGRSGYKEWLTQTRPGTGMKDHKSH